MSATSWKRKTKRRVVWEWHLLLELIWNNNRYRKEGEGGECCNMFVWFFSWILSWECCTNDENFYLLFWIALNTTTFIYKYYWNSFMDAIMMAFSPFPFPSPHLTKTIVFSSTLESLTLILAHTFLSLLPTLQPQHFFLWH